MTEVEKTGHTEGEWTVAFSERWPWDISVMAGDKEVVHLRRVAHSTRQGSLTDCRNGVGFKGEEREAVIAAIAQQEANARLIAAAPDMFEALKLARRYVADLPIVGDADLAVIDAALAKATTPDQGGEG